jgi:hypothetical protein
MQTNFSFLLPAIFKKSVIVPVMACMLAVAGASIVASAPAEAASKVKQVKIGLKFGAKAFKRLEEAGRKAQSKRGIAKVTGGILKNVGKGGGKVTKAASRGVGKATSTVNRTVSRSKVGRSVQKGFRNAQRWQNKQIDKAFRSCRSKACDFGKGAARFVAPL